ncbi:MAG: hypothetical protein DRQ47_02815 [Gammaproteobacteria bacterium]|nr:MAG: hypothetical protein DRQ47_02815 [Gammaproteobacteria bacterium]
MKRLSNGLKKMLAGLAHQDAGEFLSMGEKLEVLGYGTKTKEKPLAAPRKVVRRPVTKRIALISDGRGLGAPLDYAIEACLRQGAQIDLLTHGAIDTEIISVLEKQVQQAGLDCQHIQLGVNVVDDLIDYIFDHRSLIFLVAIPDDNVARVLIEDVIPKRGGRIPVPLVLIEDQAAAQKHKQSAA